MKNQEKQGPSSESKNEKTAEELNLDSQINNLKVFFQLFDPDKLNLTDDVAAMKRRIQNIRSAAEKAKEHISKETKIFLIKLEGLLEYFNALAEKAPIVKKGLLTGGISKRRDSIADLTKYICELIEKKK